jgi:hypothetical protein
MARWRHHASALAVYRDPGEDPISFGDIFEGEHLIDVHAKLETRPLGGGDTPRITTERILKKFNRDLISSDDPVPVYSPALPPLKESFHALAFGGDRIKDNGPLRAILISDSCIVDTALGGERGRRPQGRLLFAPVVNATDAQITKLQERRVFGRFPLPKDTDLHFDGGVAELRDCFMVDARDVRATDRIITLSDEAAEDLEAAWDVSAMRRGPHVVEHNVTKLARSLAGGDEDVSDADVEAVEMIAQTLIAAWRLEGGLLRAAADAQEPDAEALHQMVAELKDLEESARLAHERLTGRIP